MMKVSDYIDETLEESSGFSDAARMTISVGAFRKIAKRHRTLEHRYDKSVDAYNALSDHYNGAIGKSLNQQQFSRWTNTLADRMEDLRTALESLP
jgi:hypothetical protein